MKYARGQDGWRWSKALRCWCCGDSTHTLRALKVGYTVYEDGFLCLCDTCQGTMDKAAEELETKARRRQTMPHLPSIQEGKGAIGQPRCLSPWPEAATQSSSTS